ncbi:MAG: amidohydrolase [Acidobacteria bacterium]|nr:MAG: amidohydrolase [Acidobacteriota bacterium]
MRRICLILVLWGCSRLFAQTLSPEVKEFVKVDAPIIALEHVRVIDGTGAAAKDDQTLVLANGKIRSVGGVIPGLVGMHDHMFYPMGNGVYGEMAYSFPRLYLAAGVTTIRTTGSLEPYTDLEVKRNIDTGETPGPKIHATGPYIEGKGSWVLQAHKLTGPDDATKFVNFWLDQGADNFKIYNFVTADELSAAIKAAHKRGAKVTGHLCSIGFRQAAQLGIDDLEHGLLVDTEFFSEKKADECPDVPDEGIRYGKMEIQSGPVHDTIVDLVQHHVALTSTLPVFEMDVPGRPSMQKRVLDALTAEARSAVLVNKLSTTDQARTRKRYGMDVSPWGAAFKKEMEFEREFAKQGGLLLAGLDPTGMGGIVAGFGDQRELELLVEAGFSPLEAIHIATYNGAQYLGDLDKVGTIAAGKQADLVVIKGDPSQKIEDVENVEIVFKDGVGYDSAKLIESVKGMVGSR